MDRTERTGSDASELFSGEGEPRRGAVHEEAVPIVSRWERDGTLEAVRGRLRGLLGGGLSIVAIQVFLDPGGLTGLLVFLWFLLAVPVVALAACLLVTLRHPGQARDVWWEDGTMATVGLIALAGLGRAGRASPAGRAVWQLLFGDDGPDEADYHVGTDGAEMDLSAVARLRRYVRYAILASAALILFEQTVRGNLAGLSLGVLEGVGPLAWVALVVVGAVLGALLAVVGK